MQIHSFAAFAAKETLRPFCYETAELPPHEVEIEISHCGICHSDIHLIDNDWGFSLYPLVPGHEIVGTVRAVGSAVTNLAAGQRVGVGWQRGSCMNCEWCVAGHENCCPQNHATCVGNYGGFACAVRADSRFAFAIPDALPSEVAGPLMCGGATVFSPLRRSVKPGMKVGVIGVGGLGHMALQFARAMGAEVTAFSTSPSKEREARKFGAHNFVATGQAGAVEAAAFSQDFLLNTVHVPLDWGAWINVVRPNGTFCMVGAPTEPLAVSAFALIMGQRSVTGSAIGSRAAIADMLQFAAEHDVHPQVEVMPIAKVNEALDRVRCNQARYRMVLEG